MKQRKFRRWPISVGFARHTALHTFDWHGWELRDGTYGRTIHIGPVKVFFGPRAPERTEP